MTEPARLARNAARLAECHPLFRARVAAVLFDLEATGWRPRIQDAWRSPAEQLAAYERGSSERRYGFHNVTSAEGRREALAVDVLDDDAPLAPTNRYLLALAIAAKDHRLATGITWGLPPALRAAVTAAIEQRDIRAYLKTGWDPTHVEVTGLTVAQARRGARP